MIENQLAIELKKKYDAGERDFRNLELRRVDLRGLNLSQANFKGADLSYSNLRDINLSGADLSDAFLNEADLTGANLQGANLTETYLIKAYLIKANLQEANLNKAYLTGAYLSKSNLSNANLTGAYLNGAKLNGADLTGAFYDTTTHFDVHFTPNKAGMKTALSRNPSLLKIKVTVEDLLNTLNHLSQLSNRYLGSTMTVRYWDNARPQSEWLHQFQLTSKAEINFTGTQKGYLEASELRLAQEWVNRFVKTCSQIIQDYPKMIDRKQIVFNIAALSTETAQPENHESDESIMRFSSSVEPLSPSDHEDTMKLF